MTFNNVNNWNLGSWPFEGVDCSLCQTCQEKGSSFSGVTLLRLDFRAPIPLLQALPLELHQNWGWHLFWSQGFFQCGCETPRGRERDQGPRCRGRIARPLKARAPAAPPSRPLLSAGLSCGSRTSWKELEKHQELLRLPAVSVETRLARQLGLSRSWTLCASALPCLFVRALCGVREQSIQPLAFPFDGINVYQMRGTGAFASRRQRQHTNAVPRLSIETDGLNRSTMKLIGIILHVIFKITSDQICYRGR